MKTSKNFSKSPTWRLLIDRQVDQAHQLVKTIRSSRSSQRTWWKRLLEVSTDHSLRKIPGIRVLWPLLRARWRAITTAQARMRTRSKSFDHIEKSLQKVLANYMKIISQLLLSLSSMTSSIGTAMDLICKQWGITMTQKNLMILNHSSCGRINCSLAKWCQLWATSPARSSSLASVPKTCSNLTRVTTPIQLSQSSRSQTLTSMSKSIVCSSRMKSKTLTGNWINSREISKWILEWRGPSLESALTMKAPFNNQNFQLGKEIKQNTLLQTP